MSLQQKTLWINSHVEAIDKIKRNRTNINLYNRLKKINRSYFLCLIQNFFLHLRKILNLY
jgi:hypothetical protein